jgi:SAM-dependent methyltransferase
MIIADTTIDERDRGMTNGARMLPGLEEAARTMPFDQFGRYHMVREAVDACRGMLRLDTLTILDVGGFFRTIEGEPTLPLQTFLPTDTVTIVDVVDCDLPGYIKGDGAALTFDDATFDLVVTCDTLEHVPQPRRAAFWRELLRVARHGVILAAPFGTPEVELAEAIAATYIRVESGREQPQLKEHREYGLPNLDEWLEFLEQSGHTARAYPTGYLHAWLSMMLLKHLLMHLEAGVEGQYLLDGYYNRCYFPTERRNPAYRQVIVAEKTTGLLSAVDAALAPTIMPAREDASSEWGGAVVPIALALMQRQMGTLVGGQKETGTPVRPLEQLVLEQQALLAHMHAQVVEAQTRAELQSQQHAAAIRDHNERSVWLEGQVTALRHHLLAVQNGRIMRILNRCFRRQ